MVRRYRNSYSFHRLEENFFYFFFYTWNQGNLTAYLLILDRAGELLYDLRPDWIVKTLAHLFFRPIGQKSRTLCTLCSIGWWLCQYSPFSKTLGPGQKASVRLSLSVTPECPFSLHWMPRVCTHVWDYVIRGTAGELFIVSLKPPMCQLKAIQSQSG